MKTLVLGLSLTALFATPAAAQQVVELPSLNGMIEQAVNGGTIQQAEATARDKIESAPLPRPTKKQRQDRAQPQEDVVGNQREAEAAAARANEIARKTAEGNDTEVLKALKKIQRQLDKQKKYKPLKRVKFLPPNSKNY